MSEVLSFVEIDGQHVELLPARTVLSMFTAGCGCSKGHEGGGGDGGVGGKGGSAQGGLGINILSGILGTGTASAGDAIGGNGGSANGGNG